MSSQNSFEHEQIIKITINNKKKLFFVIVISLSDLKIFRFIPRIESAGLGDKSKHTKIRIGV